MAPRNKPNTEDKQSDTSTDESAEDQAEDDSSDEDTGEDGESETEEADDTEEEMVVQEAPKPAMLQKPPVGVKSAIQPDTMMQKVEDAPPGKNPDDVSDHILDSPQAFGIWIDGKLHRFLKGKTQLTHRQKEACLTHDYVRANGASVLKLVKRPKAK